MPADQPELSESAARVLLARAAETVEVDPAPPPALADLREPSRRRWPAVVAAAAAVVLVVTGAALLTARQDRRPTVTGVGPPVEHVHVYGRQQMPSLIGYTSAEAEHLLEQRGLSFQVQMERTMCNVDGQVLGTRPSAGAAVHRGMAVTLSVAHNGNAVDCVGEPDWRTVWALIRYARGIGPAPEFAPSVTATVEDSDGRTVSSARLTGAEAARPSSWVTCSAGQCHSALAGVAEMVSAEGQTVNGAPQPPFVNAGAPALMCARADRSGSLRFWLEIPTDGIFCPTSSVAIARDSHGRIAGVTYVAPAVPDGDSIRH